MPFRVRGAAFVCSTCPACLGSSFSRWRKGVSPGFVGYTISREHMENKRKPQIDLARQMKVPDDGDEGLSPAKTSRKSDGKSGAGVTAAELQLLLSQQTAQLAQAQELAVSKATAHFEAVVAEKVGRTDSRVDELEKKLESLAEKFQSMVSGNPSGPAGGQADAVGEQHRRQRTLIYGGWARDTRRPDLLHELQKALVSLGVAAELDDTPFATGARRSIALSGFKERPGETYMDMRARMQKVIRAFADAGEKAVVQLEQRPP